MATMIGRDGKQYDVPDRIDPVTLARDGFTPVAPAPAVNESTKQTKMGKAPLDLGADLAGMARIAVPALAASALPALIPTEGMGLLGGLAARSAMAGLGGAGGQAGIDAATGVPAAQIPGRALGTGLFSGAAEPIASMIGGGLGMVQRNLNRAAFSPSPKLAGSFPDLLENIGQAGTGLGPGSNARAAQMLGDAAKAERNVYRRMDTSGWTMNPTNLAPDPASLVPARTPGRDAIISKLEDVRDQFLNENQGPLKPTDIADIAKAHRKLGTSIMDAVNAGTNPADEAYVAQLHNAIYGNAREALVGKLLNDQGAQVPGGAAAGTARGETQAAIGVRRATSAANARAEAGMPARIGWIPPPISYVIPKAAQPAITMSRPAAATAAQFVGHPATSWLAGLPPRLLAAALAQSAPADMTQQGP